MEKLNNKRDIVIIIPYINLPGYIKDLLATIKTKYTYKIYLIDNNSTQDTKRSLFTLASRNDLEFIYNDTNIGVASSWNQGVKLGVDRHYIDFAVVLNNDILLHPDCIDNMIKVSKDGNFPLVSGFDFAKECAVPHEILEKSIPKKTFVVDAPEFSCYTLNIKLLENLKDFERGKEEYPGRFDQKYYPAYFEDNDLHYRFKLAKMRAVKTNTALYYHYGSRTIKENPDMDSINSALYLQNQRRYIEKWGGKPGHEKFKIPFNQDN